MSADRLQRVEELYHAAIARSADTREAFLDQACSGDTALRDEVLSLLAHAPSAADFLERATVTVPAASGAMALIAGALLGPYEILGPIAAGGMGEVYRARDTRLDRTVAVKILPAHLRANVRLLARFEREARAIAGLNHPHICTLYDVGFHEGIDFLVMEYIEGETLRSRLLRGPLSIEETVRCGGEIAAALAAAHGQGLVHRDIKPSNIIVTPAGHARVVDFGLARLVALMSGGEPMRTEPTESGVVVGTPYYMSPEQARGLPLDVRTDVFSLGVVMFECLTGRLPFDGEMRDDYLQALLTGEPLAIGELRTDVPVDLQGLIARCLQRDVSARIESATKLKAELDRIARGRVAGSPVASAHRQPLVIAGVLVAAATLLVLWRFTDPQKSQGTAAGAESGSSISRTFVPDGMAALYLPGPEVSMPEVATRVLPPYPRDGAAQRFRGNIDVEVVVGADGQVATGRVPHWPGEGPRVTRWPGDRLSLVKETLEALRRWRFRPAVSGGDRLVAVVVLAQFVFEPPAGPGQPARVSAELSPLPRFSKTSPELFATAVDGKTPGLKHAIPLRSVWPSRPASLKKLEKGSGVGTEVDVVVLPDGSVGAVRSAEWPEWPGLAEELMAAAGRWLFEPALLDGKRVATKLTLMFSFTGGQ